MNFTWFQIVSNLFDRLDFRQCRSNRDRIRFIDQHRDEFIDEMFNHFRKQFDNSVRKSSTDSIRYRKQGNDAFVKKDLSSAIQFYHQSIALAPINSEERALAYGNLSAVLFESHFDRETLQAIDLATEFYPKNLQSKLDLRRTLASNRLKELDKNKANVSFEESSSLYHGVHQHISSASSALRLRHSEEKGRHLIAEEDIPKDALLIKEHPYACLLPRELALNYCDNCLTELRLSYPCDNCSDVLFCSEQCRENSLKTYHRYECEHMSLLNNLGIAFLAYRTLTNTDPSILIESIDKSDESYSSDYRSISQLVTHSESTSYEDVFHYSLTGYLLLSLLDGTSYSTIDRIHLGSILVDHIEQMICNAQTVSINCVNSSDQHVASAILPVCALMNHSCLPNIRCLYHQGYFYVYARRMIVQGEEILNCYGPEKSLIPSTIERQRLLFDQYFFKCHCEGCRSTTTLFDSSRQ